MLPEVTLGPSLYCVSPILYLCHPLPKFVQGHHCLQSQFSGPMQRVTVGLLVQNQDIKEWGAEHCTHPLPGHRCILSQGSEALVA